LDSFSLWNTQDKGGQCLSDFERGEAEEIACGVVQRVFREGTPEEQQALLRDELARYARKLYSYNRGGRVAEIFGIYFPSELRSLIPSTGVDVPSPSGRFETVSIERGKAFLEALNETATKGEAALEALVAGYELLT
jgi:DNA-binding IclR family transcriptional regulator